jgi:1-acyl-sn-glycerol-3-phosphate acyltransferase
MSYLRITFAALLVLMSTLFHVPIVVLAAIFKAVIPLRPARRFFDRILIGMAESWNAFNAHLIRLFTRTRFVIDNEAQLRREGHYLILSNHQSWVDIPVLESVLNRRVPMLRFFLKSQLFWVPMLGLAWWALDFPFMKRYSRETIARKPELAGRDIAATRRACEKFRGIPVALINFVEGTRFTPAKHAAQGSRFRYLLKPKAGGVAFVLDAMGDAMHAILDVTIVYPHGIPTIADLFADRVPEVRIHIRELPIPYEMVGGDYQNDEPFRELFQTWMNRLWNEKDARVEALLRSGSDGAGTDLLALPRPLGGQDAPMP